MTAPLSASRAGRRYVACWIALGATVLAGGLLFVMRDSSPKTVELSFEPPASSGNADEQTLRSIRKVGDLYLVTSHGDYEARLQWLGDYHWKSLPNWPRLILRTQLRSVKYPG